LCRFRSFFVEQAVASHAFSPPFCSFHLILDFYLVFIGQILALTSSILVVDTIRKFVLSRQANGGAGVRGMGRSAPLFSTKSVENMV
jgi:hypothetical protein